MSAVEYRVVSKRVGVRPVVKRFSTLRGAQHRLTLLGPEPWLAYGKEPDERWCCGGHDGCHPCPCMGETERQRTAALRADMPPLEFVRLEAREVGEWRAADQPVEVSPEHAAAVDRDSDEGRR